MNEKDLFNLFKSEIEKQGAIEVWTSNPQHFCDPSTKPAIYIIVPAGQKFNIKPFNFAWSDEDADFWNEPIWLPENARFGLCTSPAELHQIYNKGVWTLNA